jgi:hypothetical protein
MTIYRFHYYEVQERTHDIRAASYWQAVHEFKKTHNRVRAWKVERVK